MLPYVTLCGFTKCQEGVIFIIEVIDMIHRNLLPMFFIYFFVFTVRYNSYITFLVKIL